MLWLENNFGRIYCNTGQKQPPCPCIKHSLYIVKWHQTSKYVIIPPASENFFGNCSQRKMEKTCPRHYVRILGLLKQ